MQGRSSKMLVRFGASAALLVLLSASAALAAHERGETLTERVKHAVGLGSKEHDTTQDMMDKPKEWAAAAGDKMQSTQHQAGDAAQDLKDAAAGTAAAQAVKHAKEELDSHADAATAAGADTQDPRSFVGKVIDSVLGKSHATATDRVSDVMHDVTGKVNIMNQREHDDEKHETQAFDMHEASETAKETAGGITDKVRNAAAHAGGAVKEKAASAKDSVKGAVGSATDSVKGAAESVKGAAQSTAEGAKSAAQDAAESTMDAAHAAKEKLTISAAEAGAKVTGAVHGKSGEAAQAAQAKKQEL